jgi:4-amino-4-deoxy-L-arabinose transferase-like glycosyltransferase
MAWAIGLGVDESYMVASGRHFRLGYFDHPPLSWWLSACAAQVLGSETELAVRLPFIGLFALSTWLMYRLGTLVASPRAGLWAAIAFNLSPVFGVTTGGWVLPDGPLVCALLAAGLCLLRALPACGRAAWGWWLGAGLSAGLALLSKYSAVLTLAGAFVYLLTQPEHRRWLSRPHPYVACLLAATLFSPVVAWNAMHDWASFAFQGGRAAAHTLHTFAPLVTLAGEALFLLPWIWLGLVFGFVRALRSGPAQWRTWLLCCLAAGPIVLFGIVSLWSRKVLFHWAAPGYLFLFPLLGADIARWLDCERRPIRFALAGSAALLGLGLLLVVTEVRWHWLAATGLRADPALEAVDWNSLRPELARRGLFDRPSTVIVGDNWSDTGKLDYALGGDPPVMCLNVDCREYTLARPAALALGHDVLIVAPRQTPASIDAAYGHLFDTIESLPPVLLRPPGRMSIEIPLFLGHRLREVPRKPDG